MKAKKIIFPIICIILVLFITVPFLVSCNADIEGVNGTDIINLIFPNPYVFAAQIIASIVLFSLVLKFVWKPYNKLMDAKKEYAMSEIREAELVKIEAYENNEKAKNEFILAQAEAVNIINDANEKANLLKIKLLEEAEFNSQLLITKSEKEIEKTKKDFELTKNDEILDLAMNAAEALTRKNISSKDNEDFIKDFISKIDKEL